MKIALAHDHLISDGGGERVLKALSEIWPQAPIYTLVFDPPRTHPFFQDKQIITSYLQSLPMAASRYQWYLPLRPRAIQQLDLSGFDVVLSDSASLIKGLRLKPDALHIDYCHTPTRFLWVDPEERLDPLERIFPVNQLSRRYKEKLKTWDLSAAQRVNAFVANSRFVQDRIKKYYNRESKVIYPPVEIQTVAPKSAKKGGYFLTGGRIASYKKFDLTVEAFNKLNMPLKIFGTGPWLSALKRKAGKTIEFVGSLTESEKISLFAGARAFIYPQVEDFGITAVESMMAGRPVIAYRAGGVLETVIAGRSGVFFDDQDWASLADAVIRFQEHDFNPDFIQQHAQQFSAAVFKAEIRRFVEEQWERFKSGKLQS